jgi:hypothetical protein
MPHVHGKLGRMSNYVAHEIGAAGRTSGVLSFYCCPGCKVKRLVLLS